MDWITRLNESIEYIEANLSSEVDYDKLAQIALCSTYHYQRMFAYMTDTTLAEYIRRRRMSLAAADIQNGEKIIDVALKYGYASPTAFNRAFQQVHGVAPSRSKSEGTVLKSFPPIRFKITIKGADEMEYRIEKKGPIRIVGISHPLVKELEDNFKIVPKMWDDASKDGTLQKICGYMNSEPMGILGASVMSGNEMRYFIAAASTKEIADSGFEEHRIPAATWAIFSGSGDSNQTIQTLLKQVYQEWLPTSGYKYSEEASTDLEVYISPDPKNAKFEVWMPVVKE